MQNNNSCATQQYWDFTLNKPESKFPYFQASRIKLREQENLTINQKKVEYDSTWDLWNVIFFLFLDREMVISSSLLPRDEWQSFTLRIMLGFLLGLLIVSSGFVDDILTVYAFIILYLRRFLTHVFFCSWREVIIFLYKKH